MKNSNWKELLDDVFDLKSKSNTERSVAKNEQRLGTIIDENQIEVLELTVSLRKTKFFDDTKESYLALFMNIINYISLYIDAGLSFKYVFENGNYGGKLHLHASICLEMRRVYNRWGLVEMIARRLCELTRRKYCPNNLFSEYPRYQSIPFTLQCNDRKEYWENYIHKNIKEV